jgi:hypothetical protein
LLVLLTCIWYSSTLLIILLLAAAYACVYVYYERMFAMLLMWKLTDVLGWEVLIAAASLRVDFSYGLRKPRVTFRMENLQLLNPQPTNYARKCFLRCEEFCFELLLEKIPREGDALHFLRVSWTGVTVNFARTTNATKLLNLVALDTVRVVRKLKRKGLDLAKLGLNCLRVKVISARGLRGGDIGTIDPRVAVRYQNAKEHTSTKVATCNPVWDDEGSNFNFWATNPMTAVEFTVECYEGNGACCWRAAGVLLAGCWRVRVQSLILHPSHSPPPRPPLPAPCFPPPVPLPP